MNPELEELLKRAIRAGYEDSMNWWDGYYRPKPSEYEKEITEAVDAIFAAKWGKP